MRLIPLKVVKENGYKELHAATDGKIYAGITACCLALLAHVLPSGLSFVNTLQIGLTVVYFMLNVALHMHASLVERGKFRFVKQNGAQLGAEQHMLEISSKLQQCNEELELTLAFPNEIITKTDHRRVTFKICELVYDDLVVAEKRLSSTVQTVLQIKPVKLHTTTN